MTMPRHLVIEPAFPQWHAINVSKRMRRRHVGKKGRIPTVMLDKSDLLSQKSLSPRYEKVAEAPYSGTQWNIYVLTPPASVSDTRKGP